MRNLTSLAIASSLFAVGCMKANDSDSTDTAASAIDSSDATQSEGNMMMASVDGSDMTSLTAPTREGVAARVAANALIRWTPSSCLTATATGANVTLVYDDCTGPRGLVHVSGELDLTISVSLQGVISVQGSSSDLKVNGADLVVDATGTYAVSGTTHTLAVQTMGSGTGALGNTVDHEGNYTISWDTTTQCGSIDGSWSTEISTPTASAERSNDVNVSRCATGCPTGSITHHFLGGASISITYDGTPTATWSASTGISGTVQLLCQ
jgi:hypothetical protein